MTVGWRIWLLCFLTYAFFVPGNGPNGVSRAALSLAIAERHELRIDPLAPFTIDRAFANGAWYSDKAPGLSFLAVPVAWAASQVLDRDGTAWVGPGPALSARFSVFIYFASLCTTGLLAAAAAAGIHRWALTLGASGTGALLAALTSGFATPFWGWATMFLGHAASGALLLFGFAGLAGSIGRSAPVRPFLSGLALGAAFVVEFPAGPAVAIIGLSCAITAAARPDRRTSLPRVFIPAALGLACAVTPLLVYNAAAFGSPLKLGYESVQGFEGMKTGLFGISAPNPVVARDLLVGWYRGLLPLSPVLILWPAAIVLCLRDRGWRLTAIVSVLVFAYYLGMNAGYVYWDGGWATGPRHLVPALPLMALPLAALWDKAGRIGRGVFLVLLMFSVEASLICASVDMAPPPEVARPLIDYLIPAFFSGGLTRVVPSYTFGVHGPLALAPLLLIWVVVGWPLLPRVSRNQVAS